MSTPHEAEKLAGNIAVDIYDQFWAKDHYRYGYPSADFELIGCDEGEELGIAPADDPYWTGLRRKSDGQLFEIEFEVTARAIDPPPLTAEIPGQQELLEVPR